MEQQKLLLELLLDPIESERAKALADTLFQLESYVRNISLSLSGIEARYKLPVNLSRDIWTLRSMADEVSSWLNNHYMPLYQYADRKQAPEAEKAESAERVVH